MIARANHEEIMAYMAHFPFCAEAQVALIERGNHEEILYFVTHYEPYAETRIALEKRDNAEEIAAMNKAYGAFYGPLAQEDW